MQSVQLVHAGTYTLLHSQVVLGEIIDEPEGGRRQLDAGRSHHAGPDSPAVKPRDDVAWSVWCWISRTVCVFDRGAGDVESLADNPFQNADALHTFRTSVIDTDIFASIHKITTDPLISNTFIP